MSVIIPQESGRSAVAKGSAAQFPYGQLIAWRFLGWLGVAYLVMSLIDLGLGWYPLGFGSSEWEFGTVSATLNGLAIPTLSLYLILCSAIVRERINVVRAVSIAMICIAVFMAILFLLYLTAVPLALRSVTANPIIHQGMKKAIVKASALFVGYEILLITAPIKSLRRRNSI